MEGMISKVVLPGFSAIQTAPRAITTRVMIMNLVTKVLPSTTNGYEAPSGSTADRRWVAHDIKLKLLQGNAPKKRPKGSNRKASSNPLRKPRHVIKLQVTSSFSIS